MSGELREFMNSKPGTRLLENIGRIATALERIADYLGEVRDDHKRGIEAKYGLRKHVDLIQDRCVCPDPVKTEGSVLCGRCKGNLYGQ